jgi:hypothetical protein
MEVVIFLGIFKGTIMLMEAIPVELFGIKTIPPFRFQLESGLRQKFSYIGVQMAVPMVDIGPQLTDKF